MYNPDLPVDMLSITLSLSFTDEERKYISISEYFKNSLIDFKCCSANTSVGAIKAT